MTIRELIQQLEDHAAFTPSGFDAEVQLYDRTSGIQLRVDPDQDVFDFEVLRGDDAVVIEF